MRAAVCARRVSEPRETGETGTARGRAAAACARTENRAPDSFAARSVSSPPSSAAISSCHLPVSARTPDGGVHSATSSFEASSSPSGTRTSRRLGSAARRASRCASTAASSSSIRFASADASATCALRSTASASLPSFISAPILGESCFRMASCEEMPPESAANERWSSPICLSASNCCSPAWRRLSASATTSGESATSLASSVGTEGGALVAVAERRT